MAVNASLPSRCVCTETKVRLITTANNCRDQTLAGVTDLHAPQQLIFRVAGEARQHSWHNGRADPPREILHYFSGDACGASATASFREPFIARRSSTQTRHVTPRDTGIRYSMMCSNTLLSSDFLEPELVLLYRPPRARADTERRGSSRSKALTIRASCLLRSSEPSCTCSIRGWLATAYVYSTPILKCGSSCQPTLPRGSPAAGAAQPREPRARAACPCSVIQPRHIRSALRLHLPAGAQSRARMPADGLTKFDSNSIQGCVW